MWKFIATALLLCAAIFLGAANQSVVRAGPPVAHDANPPPAPQPTAAPTPEPHDPNKPYPLGPHPIEYDQLSAADKAAVDLIQETVETSQAASSYKAWSAATKATGDRAAAEIAARGIGLVGTEQDGVVP